MTQTQNCPLCDSAAKFEWLDSENLKHFHCPQCVEFIISAAAEKRLSEHAGNWRGKLAQSAACAHDGDILLIRRPASASHQADATTEALEASLVPRTNWRL